MSLLHYLFPLLILPCSFTAPTECDPVRASIRLCHFAYIKPLYLRMKSTVPTTGYKDQHSLALYISKLIKNSSVSHPMPPLVYLPFFQHIDLIRVCFSLWAALLPTALSCLPILISNVIFSGGFPSALLLPSFIH